MRLPALVTFGTNAAAVSLSLLNVLIVARALGAVGRGEIVLLMTVATLVSQAAAFGLQEANATIGASESGSRSRLATNSLLVAAVVGSAAGLTVAGLSVLLPALRGDVGLLPFIVAVGTIPVLLVKLYLSFLVQSVYAFTVTNAAWLLGPLTALTLNGALWLLGALTVETAIGAWSAGQAAGAGLLVVYTVRSFGLGRPDRLLAKRALAFGARTHLGRFMALGNYRLDQWFLGVIAGPRELGLYSIAVAWAELLFYIPGVLVMIARPRLVRATAAEAGVIAAKAFRVGAILTGVAAAFLILFAPALCAGVFGTEFSGSIDDLRVLALAGFGILALEVLGGAIIAQRRPLFTTAAVGLAFAATLALDVVLIPLMGGLGAAIATAVAWSVGGIAVSLLFARALRVPRGRLVPGGTDAVYLARAVRDTLPQLIHRAGR